MDKFRRIIPLKDFSLFVFKQIQDLPWLIVSTIDFSITLVNPLSSLPTFPLMFFPPTKYTMNCIFSLVHNILNIDSAEITFADF